MKKNLYYAEVFQRSNLIKMAILGFFMAIASWPRLLLEVFIRKNFGERYFSLATAITIAVVLTPIPFLIGGNSQYNDGIDIVAIHFTWYLFLIAFLVMSYIRQKEVDREPSVFDFARFSLSTGLIHPKFYEIKIYSKKDENGKHIKVGPDDRQISTIFEPLFFLVIGLVFLLLGQSLGYLLVVSSICYSFSYVAAFSIGDHFIMDKIDEMICNEEMVNSFVDDQEPSQTRGFYAYGRRPADPDFRRKLAETFIENSEEFEVS
jgi:hypothetical protein